MADAPQQSGGSGAGGGADAAGKGASGSGGDAGDRKAQGGQDDKGKAAADDGQGDAGKKDDGGQGGGDSKQGDAKKKPMPLWPWVVGGVLIVIFALVVLWIIFSPHARIRTDDAYVTAHYAAIAPRVAGQVSDVPVTDNQRVRAGDLLLALDDRDYRAALHQAEAALAGDQAQVAQAAAQIGRQAAVIRQARAQIGSVEAHRELSAADTLRYTNLAALGAGTVQQRQQSTTALRQDSASLVQARADLAAQVKQLDALRATLASTNARVALDEAQVEQARLNLSYTRVVAPIDGAVDQRQVQVGNIVQPGSPVMTVVPLQGVYVMANYRELSLRHMRPGQPARIHLDAYDVDLQGRVDSIPPASGAAYAPIPPNNATGNFTKIVQRLPVKVVFVAGQPLLNLVRVGMSTEVVVDTGLEDVVAEQRNRRAPLPARPPAP